MTKRENYSFYNFHGIKSANIHVSDICNFRCKICNLRERKKLFVPLSILKNKIKIATQLGLNNLILTGQEVILHPEIDKIIEFSFKKGKVNYIVFSTNGLAFASSSIWKRLNSVKKYLEKVYITISVNCYDQITFSQWSGHRDKAVFEKWSAGIKKAFNYLNIDTIDIILKKDTNIIKIWSFLTKISNGKDSKSKFCILELMPFGQTVNHFYKKLKYKLLGIKRKITEIINSCFARKIQFEYFPICLYSQIDLKNGKYFIINDYLMFENGLPVQYDPLIYHNYYQGEIENWLIDQKKLISSYNKMFCYIEECKNCYYKNKCYGIQKEYLKCYSKESVNQEIRLLKSMNWK